MNKETLLHALRLSNKIQREFNLPDWFTLELFSIEKSARRLSESSCNGYIDEDKYEKRIRTLENRVLKMIKEFEADRRKYGHSNVSLDIDFQVGGDPRGACLYVWKISELKDGRKIYGNFDRVNLNSYTGIRL
jgi:hypothetical protein